MDEVKLQIELVLSGETTSASKDSLIIQLDELIASALEERQIEIPDAEIEDYDVTYEDY